MVLTVDLLLIDIQEQTDMKLPKSAVAYVNDWVKAGYLTHRNPQGTHEEFYELSMDALLTIDHVQQLINPQRSVTKSRLGTLFSGLHRLAAKTDPDEVTAFARLEHQQDRLQERVDQIRTNGLGSSQMRRRCEILDLVSDLPADSLRVREKLEQVDRV